MYDKDHGIVILDQNGVSLLSAGKEFFSEMDREMKLTNDENKIAGSKVITVEGKDLLL